MLDFFAMDHTDADADADADAERAYAVNASEFRSLHARYDPASAEPERHRQPGRRLELAEARCTLASLRVVQDMRTRQNGGPERCLRTE